MSTIRSVEALEALYGQPGAASLRKVANHITPEYRAWIQASPFCTLATVGPDGVDASPRGDESEVVFELDPNTLAMPDRRGNNRMDSLRNIVADGRAALMFLIPGSGVVIRVNGRAEVSVDPELIARFTKEDHPPRSVILFHVSEIYFQCTRSVIRAGLWDAASWPFIDDLPTMGQILKAQDSELDGEAFDKAWPERSVKHLW